MKSPMVTSLSWPGLIVSLLPLAAVLGINARLAPDWFPLGGIVAWAVAVFIMRRLLTGAHRRGIRLVKAGRFEEAIPLFAQSYADMCDRPWIDRFRWLLVAGCSRMTYREMALCNQAFCYGQVGNGRKMKECYEAALREFPESVMAGTALKMIDSASEKGAVGCVRDAP